MFQLNAFKNLVRSRGLIILILSFLLLLSIFIFVQTYLNKTTGLIGEVSVKWDPIIDVEAVDVKGMYTLRLPIHSEILSSNLSDEFSIEDKLVTYNPTKYSSGQYEIELALTNKPYTEYKTYLFKVDKPDVDLSALNESIIGALGSKADHYGIYVYDLLRDQEYTFQADNHFPPGSISKLPGVILTLRDIQSGKYTFDEPIMILDHLKHSETDPLGILPQGSYVTIQDLIEQSITISNNTAQYHLRDFIGGTEVLNTRIEEELKAYPYYEDPQIASARAVGTLFKKIYEGNLLDEEYKEYFYHLLSEVVPSLREGIPLGLEGENVEVLTKVGHIFTPDFSYNTYSDAGLVFGENTDYVIVILNDEAPPYPEGQYMIQELARIVNSYLD